jgi:predicted tellurium resistance membrane protein TerC
VTRVVVLVLSFVCVLFAMPLLAAVDPAQGPAAVPDAGMWTAAGLVSLLTLVALEVVLGIDNVIFIAILAGRLPAAEQPKARKLGIAMAVISRVLLLLSISWVMRLTEPLFAIAGWELSGKALILLGGGLFLIAKSTYEIHDKLEGAEEHHAAGGKGALAAVVLQIMVVDIVFSLDSVITAVGMTPHIPIMIVAVLVAATVMLVFSGPISAFVHRHPTMKMLALSFLILIGVMLVAEAFGQHIDKGYIYFAMAFALGVEFINMRLRAKATPVDLRHSALPPASEA